MRDAGSVYALAGREELIAGHLNERASDAIWTAKTLTTDIKTFLSEDEYEYTYMSVLSLKYSPPGTKAYATVKVLMTSHKALTKNARVYVLTKYLLEAARPNTTGIIDMRNTAKFIPPMYPVQSL